MNELSLSLSLSLSLPLPPPGTIAVPLPPDPITVASMGSSWISISWPSVDTYPSTTDYHVEYKLGFHDDWMTISKGFSINTCNITDLYPNAQYEIRIVSESPAGRGDPSPILSVDTLPGLPDNGVNSLKESVQLDSNTSDSLTVSWTVPEVSQWRGACHLSLLLSLPFPPPPPPPLTLPPPPFLIEYNNMIV